MTYIKKKKKRIINQKRSIHRNVKEKMKKNYDRTLIKTRGEKKNAKTDLFRSLREKIGRFGNEKRKNIVLVVALTFT